MRDVFWVNGICFLTVAKVADVCGVGQSTVWRWIGSGRLRTSKPGRCRLVKITDLRAFLESGVARGSSGGRKR